MAERFLQHTHIHAYNSTGSSSTGVMLHFAMFGRKATLPVDLVFPTPSAEKRTIYHWTGDMVKERKRACKSMREVQGGRLRRNAQMYRPLTQNMYKVLMQNIQVGCLVWYFNSKIVPWTNHKLRSFWGGLYHVI